MFDSLEVKVLFTTWWRWSDSEAQGRRREARSERSVEQRREPMNKNRMTRPTAAGERARNREAPNPSRLLVVNPAVARRRRSNLPREICGASQN